MMFNAMPKRLLSMKAVAAALLVLVLGACSRNEMQELSIAINLARLRVAVFGAREGLFSRAGVRCALSGA